MILAFWDYFSTNHTYTFYVFAVFFLVHCESFTSFKDPNLYVGPFSFINHYIRAHRFYEQKPTFNLGKTSII